MSSILKQKYRVLYQEKGSIKTLIFSKQQLESEELPKNIISIKRIGFDFNFQKRIKDSEIKDRLYELSLMVNSNIKLDQAFDILIKNEKKPLLKEFLQTLKNCFINSKDVKETLEKYRINPLIIQLFSLIQNSGNIKDNLNFLSQIIEQNHEIKSSFIKILLYPMVLLISFFIALLGIFKFVLPNFEAIFINSSYELPLATKALFFIKNHFIENLTFLAILSLLFITIFIFCYKNYRAFSSFIDMVLILKIPFVSLVLRSKILYTYFVVVSTLLKNRYEFLESLSNAKILLNNQYLFARITKIEKQLRSGKSVGKSFESSKLFDDVILNLINTGEVTNSMAIVIEEIKKIYKRRFDDSLKLFSQMIEPIFFIIVTTLILWIIFAIFVPLWSMNDLLKF